MSGAGMSAGATLIFAAGKNANESPAGHGAKRQVAGQGKQPYTIVVFWGGKKGADDSPDDIRFFTNSCQIQELKARKKRLYNDREKQ